MYHLAIELEGVEAYSQMKPSQWRVATMVKTYFVVPKPKKGCFTNLSDAIAYADPYSRIEIQTGRYFENVVITKPLEIGCPRGEEEGPELISHGVTLTLDVDEAYVHGLTIKTNEPTAFAVAVESGTPIIAGCALESISVMNEGTPVVEDCKITGSKVHGIHLTHRAGGFFRQNHVENHSWFCVWVESTGVPEFTHNKITKGDLGQIRVFGNDGKEGDKLVAPIFKFNRVVDDLKRNYFRPVSERMNPVKQTGDPIDILVAQNRRKGHLRFSNFASVIEKESKVPVVSPPHSPKATVVTRYAVISSNGANPVFSRNSVTNSLNHAFRFTEGSRGSLEHSSIHDNNGYGVVVDSESTPLISRNFLRGNVYGGIYVESAGPEIHMNEIYDGHGPAVLVSGSCAKLLVQYNNIYGTNTIGIKCENRSTGRFLNNDIRDCREVGLKLEMFSNPYFESNQVHLCQEGVVCSQYSRGVFEKNDISNNVLRNVEVRRGSVPYFHSNRMTSSQEGIVVTDSGGTFLSNYIRDNRKSQIVTSGKRCNAKFESNLIEAGREIGFLVRNDAKVELVKNQFARNIGVQLIVESRADPWVEKNVFEKGGSHGIVVRDEGCGTFVENEIKFHRGDGAQVQSASPSFRANVFDRNFGCGCAYTDDGDGFSEKNVFIGNRDGNMSVTGRMKHDNRHDLQESPSWKKKVYIPRNPNGPHIFSNWFTNSSYGVNIQDYAVCALERNRFQDNKIGVAVAVGSSPSIYLNEFEGGMVGILVHESGCGYISSNRMEAVEEGISVKSQSFPHVFWNTLENCNVGISSIGGAGFIFHNCVTHSKSAGIMLGTHSCSRVYGNILSSNQIAIQVLDQCAHGVVASNRIFHNVTGIQVQGVTTCKIECNLLVGQDNGLKVMDSGSAKFALNLIAASRLSQIEISTLADPVFDGGMLIGQGDVGIQISNKGKGTFSSMKIQGRKSGVCILSGGSPTIRNCLLTENEIGVHVQEDGEGKIIECGLIRNQRNVVFDSAGNCEVDRCVISEARHEGIHCLNDAHGIITGCKITKNKECGVLLESSSLSKFFRNVISLHPGPAVLVTNAWGTFSECTLTENSQNSFVIECDADPIIRQCTLINNKNVAVLVRKGGRGNFTSNTIARNDFGQVIVTGQLTSPSFTDNTINGVTGYGILFEDSASGTMSSNRIEECRFEGVIVKSGANPSLSDNEITMSQKPAISVSEEGRGAFHNNRVVLNVNTGIFVQGSSSPMFVGNHVSNNGFCGFIIEKGSTAILQSNEIFENVLANVSVRSAAPTLKENTMYSSTDVGLEIMLNSEGVYTENLIKLNKNVGMRIMLGSNPKCTRNVIVKETDGIIIDDSSGTYEHFLIRECSGVAVRLISAKPTLENLKISFCRLGLHSSKFAAGTMHASWFYSCTDGACFETGSETMLYRCYMDHPRNTAVQVRSHATPKIDTCVFVGALTGIQVSDRSDPKICGNSINSCATGIHLCDCKGEVKDNLFYNSKDTAIVVSENARSKIDACILIGGTGGIHAESKSHPMISSCDISSCASYGLRTEPDTKCIAEKCNFHDIRGTAIVDNATSNVSSCTVWSCASGIEFGAASTSAFRSCEIRDNIIGVSFMGGSTTTLSECIIGTSKSSNIVVNEGANPSVLNCTIFKSKAGVLSQAGSNGIFKQNSLYWNVDNFVVYGSPLIESNNVYDAGNIGIHVKGGSPRVCFNLCFDNSNYSVRVEAGSADIYDNRLYFPRDEGAFSMESGTQTRISNNTIKNVDSPPWPQSASTRHIQLNNFHKDDKASAQQLKVQRRVKDRCLKIVRTTAELMEEIETSCTVFPLATSCDPRAPLEDPIHPYMVSDDLAHSFSMIKEERRSSVAQIAAHVEASKGKAVFELPPMAPGRSTNNGPPGLMLARKPSKGNLMMDGSPGSRRGSVLPSPKGPRPQTSKGPGSPGSRRGSVLPPSPKGPRPQSSKGPGSRKGSASSRRPSSAVREDQ